MKKLLAVLVVMSFVVVACDAFDDSYDGQKNPPEVGAGLPNVGEVPAAGGDFTVDVTECTAIESVTVTKSAEEAVIKETSVNWEVAEDEAVTASAKKLGQFTTEIKISKNLADGFADIVQATHEELTFVLKQTDKEAFSVCSVSYVNNLTGSTGTIKSGEITIERFNEGDDAASALNAGSLKFTFDVAATTAVEVVKDLLGGGSAIELALEGQYYVEGVTEEAPSEAAK